MSSEMRVDPKTRSKAYIQHPPTAVGGESLQGCIVDDAYGTGECPLVVETRQPCHRAAAGQRPLQEPGLSTNPRKPETFTCRGF
jgi:hypothetical protein